MSRSRFAVLAMVLGLCALPARAWAQEELFVVNSAGHSITVYERFDLDDVSPIRSIKGAATGLNGPQHLALDAFHNELIVVNSLSVPPTISVFRADADGDVAPSRTISGANTGLDGVPRGVALDDINDELFVTVADDSVRVFARTAIANAGPLRTLKGPSTQLNCPGHPAVDPLHNEIIVPNCNSASVTIYARTAAGDMAPLRTIVGPATGLNMPVAVSLDLVNDELVVANAGNDSITVYARNAAGNSLPGRTLAGKSTGLVAPKDVLVDPLNDELIVANNQQGVIEVFSRTDSEDIGPLGVLSGAATNLSVPTGLAVATFTFPRALLALTDDTFLMGQTLGYQAVMTPGSEPMQVDIYAGGLLPDNVTFLSLVQPAPGVISFAVGPAPTPFLTNVPLTPRGLSLSYKLTGVEPVGTYLAYVALIAAGTDPFLPDNQIDLAVEIFDVLHVLE